MKNDFISEICKNMLASIEFLSKVIESCPEDFWMKENDGKISISKRVLHILESLDYRVAADISYFYAKYNKEKRPEIQDEEIIEFKKQKALKYFNEVENKIKRYLDGITEEELLKENINTKGVTNLAVIMSQLRHINLNLGYCNEIFTENNIKPIGWISTFKY